MSPLLESEPTLDAMLCDISALGLALSAQGPGQCGSAVSAPCGGVAALLLTYP